MIDKIKFQLEYEIKSSPRILYSFISEVHGLSQWFADDVNVSSNVFTFTWSDEIMKATLLQAVDNKKVRFHNIEDTENYYFEMEIVQDDITNDIALLITDFSTKENLDERKMIWDAQIQILHQVLGG